MSGGGGSNNYYKELCNELKQDLKRKKRELEDVDDRFRRCESETKKAKIESQEIMKLYHGLQRELQLAYERNAKLQVDKVTYEALLDSERKDFETFKSKQQSTAEDGRKLKDALCAMRMEKLELETKFNTIVMENKDLRDRARQYEPRLREMDEIKKKVLSAEQFLNDQLKPEILKQNELIQKARVDQDQIDRYSKWNDLLKRECVEKSQQLTRYEELFEYSRRLEEEKCTLQLELDELKSKSIDDDYQATTSRSKIDNNDLVSILSKTRQLRDSLFQLEIDFRKEVASCSNEILAIADRLKEFSSTGIDQSESVDLIEQTEIDNVSLDDL